MNEKTREIKFRYWTGSKMDTLKLGEDWYDMPSDLHVMQYTGLKDKNGKEIYEGDIIQHHDHYDEPLPRGVVGWDESDAGFTVGIGIPSETQSWHEVIGNIYENPELI